MKTIKELLEVYKPKAKDEQDFADKHVVIKHKDRNGNGDEVFNASKVKYNKRAAERHGYDSGEDEKVYEEVEDLDEMKNISTEKLHALVARGDSDPAGMSPAFGMQIKAARKELQRRKKPGMKEEVEDFQESYDELMRLKNNIERNQKKMRSIQGIHPEKKRLAIQIEKDTKKHKDLFNKVWSKNESVDLGEAVTVNKKNYSWGKMVTVHQGSATTYPLHPEHQEKIRKLSDGDKTSFKDETGATVHARRSGDTVHLNKPGASNRITAVAHSHFTEEVEANDEDVDLAFFEDLLEMNLDEDTFTDASLANLRVMKHKQMMKDVEKSSKIHPLMKVRKMSDARKKLAELEKVRDHYVAKHEKAQSRKKKVTEEVEDLDEKFVVVDRNKKIMHMHSTLNSANKKAQSKGLDPKDHVYSHSFWQDTYGPNNTRNEEVEDLDESAKVAAHLIKRYGDNVRKSHVRSAADDFGVGYVALAHAVRKKLGVNRLEEEQIDEISQKLAGAYHRKSVGDLLDNPLDTARKNKRRKGINMASSKTMGDESKIKARVHATEEAEQIDELSPSTMGSYINKAKTSADALRDKGFRGNAPAWKKAQNRSDSIDRAQSKIKARSTNEEAEQIDELSKKTLGSYVKKAAHQAASRGTSGGMSIARGNAEDEAAGIKAVNKAYKRTQGISKAVDRLTKEDVEAIDELSKKALGGYVKAASHDVATRASATARYAEKEDQARKAGDIDSARKNSKIADKAFNKGWKRRANIAKAVDKLTKEDIINRAIENYMPEDYTPPSLEDQFLARIEHLPEAHAVTLFALFDSLNEDNQNVMIESANTEEGVNSLLDFAIKNRGE